MIAACHRHIQHLQALDRRRMFRMTTSVKLLSLLLFLGQLVEGGQHSTAVTGPPQASFRNWLASITIHIDTPISIPPFSFLGTTYATTIDGITCSNISLGLVRDKLLPRARARTLSLATSLPRARAPSQPTSLSCVCVVVFGAPLPLLPLPLLLPHFTSVAHEPKSQRRAPRPRCGGMCIS